MAAINALLHELRYELLKVVALNAFLDAIILFLILLLVGNIFGIGIALPAGIAAAFFLINAWRRARKLNLRYVEERNPELREMLRTAADNKASDSLMAHALFSEVIERVRGVSSGTFLNFQGLVTKIGITFTLSIFILGLAFFNVNIQKFENPLAGMGGRLSALFPSGDAEMENPVLEKGDEGIYGEPSIARLGDEQLDITLQRNLNQVDFTSVQQASPDSAESLKDYPVDPAAKASQVYTGGLEDINDRKTAADYSQEIKR